MTTELPDHPESREESYLADIAGQEVTLPEKPLSRKEQYLAYIAENGGGGGGGTSNFNQLTNRPKYNNTTMTGSTNIPKVPTKTSELSNDSNFVTSSDLPTVNDATLTITQNGVSAGTFTANDADDTTIALTDTTYNAFTGTDGTAAGTAGLVPAPATTDAGKFLKADGTWDTAGGGGGGGIIELTTADYNYPTDNPTSIALWLLDEGAYSVNGNGNTVSVKMNSSRTDLVLSGLYEISNYTESGQTRKQIEGFYNENGTLRARLEQVAANGTYLSGINLAAPTISQSTGTSTTSVMSQNAVTGMVFADPNSTQTIRVGNTAIVGGLGVGIGYNSRATGERAVGLGYNAYATAPGAVAIGSGSNATSQGQMDISTTSTGYGYNSSNYRLLSGLYDGQSDHDAATKGQLDSIAIKNAGAPTTATVGTVGQLLEDTTNGKLYICTAIVPGTDPDPDTYTWTELGTGGGGSGVIELTSADYNYPTSNPSSVATWLLEDGLYKIDSGVDYKTSTAAEDNYGATTYDTIIMVVSTGSEKKTYRFSPGASINYSRAYKTNGGQVVPSGIWASLSDLYADPSTKSRVQIGSSSTQATGVNTVAIGSNAQTGANRATAIGVSTHATTLSSVAVGYGANATTQGQFDIGEGSGNNSGYNNSAYRLLTGLYDPQSAHDAATKGYVDSIAIKNAGAPTTATVGTVGQLLEDTTNGKLYICTAADTVTPSYTWEEVGTGGGGSGVIELTSADLDYPDANPVSVALWRLDPGVYSIGSDTFGGVANTSGEGPSFINQSIIVVAKYSSASTFIVTFDIQAGASWMFRTVTATGAKGTAVRISPNIVQTTGTSTTDVMSQNAVTSMVFADPATQYKIKIGAGTSTSEGNNAVEIGHNAAATGNNSVALGNTSSASKLNAIAIGQNTLARGQESIAIGDGADTGNDITNSVALGSGAQCHYKGEVNIGSENSYQAGYNSSNYRLLTGLYDPQGDHDAATKGYVDPTTDSSAPTTSTAGRLGEIRIDTTDNSAYMCVVSDSTTPAYEWKKITT